MNLKSITPSTIDKDGSIVVELSEKELEAISTFLSMARSNYGFENDTELELYINMYLAYSLVRDGNINGIHLVSLQRILSNQTNQKK